MKLPTARDYQEALQYPNDHFADPELRSAQAERDRMGLPRAISGNFASVFKVRTPTGTRYAVRCFVRYAEDQQQRYDAIAAFLAGVDASWKVDFHFLEQGIRIRGQWFPILKMHWVDARPLSRYIAENLYDPVALTALANQFRHVVADLQARGAAHGDLQHGNVMVTENGIVKLIDYDGMYVPALAGRVGHEIGHRNYQHPERSEIDFGPSVDNFSAWVIYVSLLAIAVEPSLWPRLDAGEEKLLFSREDYIDPELGPGVRALNVSTNGQLGQLTEVIKANVACSPSTVSVLHELTVPVSDRTQPDGATCVESQVPTHPEWMESHTPTQPAIRFPSLGRLKGITCALIAAVIVLSALGVAGLAPLSLAGGVDVGLLAALGASLIVAFLRLPVVAERRRYKQEYGIARKRHNQDQRQLELVEKKLIRIADDDKSMRAAHERAAGKRAQERQAELQRLQQKTQQRLAAIAKRRNDIIAVRAHELGEALRAVQQSAFRNAMAAYRISGSGVPGVGPALSAGLAARGIVTAGDFAGTGGLVQVRGIGPAKAAALEAWRLSVANRVSRKIPTSLNPSEQQRIEARHSARLQSLEAEDRQTRAAGDREVTTVTVRQHAEEATAVREAEAALVPIASRRQEGVLERRRIEAALNESELALAQADQALKPYRNIRFSGFLLSVTRGT